jgi:hypothetical protein
VARVKTLPKVLQTKQLLAERITDLRLELFGARGGPELARRLGIPTRTWYNYEGGITVPGEIILKIVEVTAVEPMWLLRGTGPKYSNSRKDSGENTPLDGQPTTTAVASNGDRDILVSSKIAVCALLKAALRLLEADLPESSNHDGTLTRPASLDGATAAVELEPRFRELNATHNGHASGNGTVE